MNTRTEVILLLVLTVALACRVGFGVGVVGLDSPAKADEADYHMLAANIADGDGFVDDAGRRTARRPPGYPAFLSALYRVTGPRQDLTRVVQIVLGVIVVLLVFSVARRHFGEGVAVMAAAFAALNPFLIFVSGYALSENLYVIVLLLAIRILPRTVDQDVPTSRWFFGAIVLALTALVRPTGLPMAVWIVAATFLVARGDWMMRVAQISIVVMVLAAALLPWAFRNQTAFGGWVGLTTHGGITFYQGNNEKVVEIPHYRGGVAPLDALPQFDELSVMGERERDREAYRLGRDFLGANVGTVPRLAWWKFKRFWRLESDMGLSGIKSGWWFNRESALGRAAAEFDAGFVYAVVAFPLFLLGIYFTRKRWRELVFLYGVILTHTAVALVFHGSIRGRIPIEPIIAVFAAVAISEAVSRMRRPEAE